jgi:hypothetical protein
MIVPVGDTSRAPEYGSWLMQMLPKLRFAALWLLVAGLACKPVAPTAQPDGTPKTDEVSA